MLPISQITSQPLGPCALYIIVILLLFEIIGYFTAFIKRGILLSRKAIRSMCIIYNCDTTPFRDNRIPLFIKAVKLNRPLQPKLH